MGVQQRPELTVESLELSSTLLIVPLHHSVEDDSDDGSYDEVVLEYRDQDDASEDAVKCKRRSAILADLAEALDRRTLRWS